ncbi:MAG: thioredoxin family protein [Limisphaerales bacterium]
MLKKTLLTTLALAVTIATTMAADLEWKTDMTKALAEAKAQKKAVLINFTGSDWCGFCIKLDKEVFATETFQEYAKENLVLVKADFPRRLELSAEQKKANEALKAQYAKQFQGYPTIVLVHADGKKAGELVGYGPGTGPDKYLKDVQGKLKN